MVRSSGGFGLVVLAACAANHACTPPGVGDAFPLVPSIADGAALGVAAVPMEFFFSSSDLEAFSLDVLGIWSGDAQVASLERDRSSSTRTYYRVSRVLEPGAYEIRLRVAAGVQPEQMSLFKPVSKQVWSIRFFVGSRFCVLHAGICRDFRRDQMTVAFRLSTSTMEGANVQLSYDSEPVACVRDPGSGGVELRSACPVPRAKTGTATFTFDTLRSADGEPLTDCNGNAARPIELQYDQVGCGSYSWR